MAQKAAGQCYICEKKRAIQQRLFLFLIFCVYCDTALTTTCYVPVELCFSFSFFFFLHFQGLKMRPRQASLLFRRMGGVWTPVTRQPDLSTLCWSISSTAVTVKEKKWGWGWYSMSEVQHHTDTDTHMIPYFLLYIPQHCDGKSLHMLVKKVMYIMSAQSSNSHSSHIHSAVFCQIN